MAADTIAFSVVNDTAPPVLVDVNVVVDVEVVDVVVDDVVDDVVVDEAMVVDGLLTTKPDITGTDDEDDATVAVAVDRDDEVIVGVCR